MITCEPLNMSKQITAFSIFFLLIFCLMQNPLSKHQEFNDVIDISSTGSASVSNNSGFVSDIVSSSCSRSKFFDVDNFTSYYYSYCPSWMTGGFDGYKIFSMSQNIETELMNVTGWEIEDMGRLSNGTIVFALSRHTAGTSTRTPFSSSAFDSKSLVFGFLLSNGTIGSSSSQLDFDGSFDVRYDLDGNAFLIGSAGNRQQTAKIESTTLSWTSVAGGTGCWSVSWISPKFISFYNHTSDSFDWVFKSNYVSPEKQNGNGFGINKAESIFFFTMSGTAQVSYQCGSTPGTHTFGSHTASAGQIIGTVTADGTFLFAKNPDTSVSSGIGRNSSMPQSVHGDGFIYETGGSSTSGKIFVNSTTEFHLNTEPPIFCQHADLTTYILGANNYNYTTPGGFSNGVIFIEETRFHSFDIFDWCIASDNGLIVVRNNQLSGPAYLMMNDIDNDDFADAVDSFPYDSTQWSDADNDGFGDNWATNSWNLSRTGGIGEWVYNAQNVDECPLTFGTSYIDRGGCIDGDGDGYSDNGDAFSQDPSQWLDSDFDGFGDNVSGLRGDSCPNTYGVSNQDRFGCPDSDYDGWSDDFDRFPNLQSQWNDTDDDGYGDQYTGFQGDACPSQFGNSTVDRFGCEDSDGDGFSNLGDQLPQNPTQSQDIDGDGYGDNMSKNATQIDMFPNDGSQWNDTDGDGHGDNPYGIQGDWFPNDPTRWQDSDRDGIADQDDAFPNDPTQDTDSDGDGYGDNQNGSNPDIFPEDSNEWKDTDGDGYGNNNDKFVIDGSQWNDSDGDGYGDNAYGTLGDWFPDDPLRWQDSDRDGTADEDDAFPYDISQWIDSDSDGYGDNPNGTDYDEFPEDSSEWQDTDGDGVGNNADAFPFDPSQKFDSDGDGFGDNDRGSGADKFPNDETQWSDIDGDGYGDNLVGNNPDAFISDPTQWTDTDGDGYGDNPTGRLSDGFIFDETQWLDQDGDGFGDNQSGNNPDPFLFDFDNDGYNDSIDPLPKFASPGDLDNDGVLDEEDMFPEDFREWADNDGDGVGDNADTDDDNDGWLDADELREGTNPFSSSEQPVDSFEIVIPGTAVGLGAWDLIGIFGGVPLFIWIGFGFITRNGRTAKYEEKLRAANTRDELESVARQWEYSLMLRMLGPHQGIRLERLRAELDDVFERQNQTLSSLEQSEYNQTQLVQEEMNQNEKQVPEINLKPDIDAVGNPDVEGYEWTMSEDGKNWYRPQGSKDDWIEFTS